MIDRAVADKIAQEFLEHKEKFKDFNASQDLYVKGEAVCRMAAVTMHTRDVGMIFMEMVFAPEGGMFMETQMNHGCHYADLSGDDPTAIEKAILSYVTDVSRFVGAGDYYLTEPEFQDVEAQIAMAKNAEGNFEPILCSVRPVGENPSSGPSL